MAIVKATYPGINPPEKTRIQVTDTVLPDADVSITGEQLIHFVLTMTPTAARTIILPPPAEILELLVHATVADGLEFTVRNFGALGNTITIVPNGGLSGSAVVDGRSYKHFIIRMDNVNSATPFYTLIDLGTSGSVAGSGDVFGPGSSTDNAVVVFDGITGKVIKETDAADALLALTLPGTGNNFIGTRISTAAITTGVNNTGLGDTVLSSLTSGTENTAVGRLALTSATTGTDNTAMGSEVLSSLTSGTDNTAMGRLALTAATTGSINTAVGSGALNSVTTAGSNTGFGAGTLASIVLATSTANVAMGLNALGSASDPSTANVAIGNLALFAVGAKADNVAMGSSAGVAVTTGADNVLLGNAAAPTLTTGDENTLVGSGADVLAAASTNTIGIGSGVIGTSRPATDQIYLDNDSTQSNVQAMFVPRLTNAITSFGTATLRWNLATGEIRGVTGTLGTLGNVDTQSFSGGPSGSGISDSTNSATPQDLAFTAHAGTLTEGQPTTAFVTCSATGGGGGPFNVTLTDRTNAVLLATSANTATPFGAAGVPAILSLGTLAAYDVAAASLVVGFNKTVQGGQPVSIELFSLTTVY